MVCAGIGRAVVSQVKRLENRLFRFVSVPYPDCAAPDFRSHRYTIQIECNDGITKHLNAIQTHKLVIGVMAARGDHRQPRVTRHFNRLG